MKVLLYLLLSLLAGVFGGVQLGLAAELIGLQNIPIEPDEGVWEFEIYLQEGRIISVCTVPEGWKITAENYGEAAEYKDGGGVVHAGADFGHDALSATDLSELGALLLIDRSAVHNDSAKLKGSITVSGPRDNRKLQLEPHNFLRRKADQCSAPPVRNRRTSN